MVIGEQGVFVRGAERLASFWGSPRQFEAVMRSIIALVAVVLSGSLVAPHALPSHTSRCSLMPGFFPEHGVIMLGTPGLDTLRAGVGDLRQGEGPGHSGNGRRNEV